MTNKKNGKPEVNPDLTLTMMAEKMKIPKSYIYQELENEKIVSSSDCARKELQRKTRLNLTFNMCQKILTAALKKYTDDIKYKPVPDGYSITKKKSFKDKQKKEAERIKAEADEMMKKYNESIKALYFVAGQPYFNENDFPSEELETSNNLCEQFFINFLSPKSAYILMQKTDAFKSVVEKSEILNFCISIWGLDEEAKKELMNVNISISNTLSEIVKSLNNKLLSDWLQIHNGYYKKIVNNKLAKYKNDIAHNKLDISKFSDDEKKDLDYITEQLFVEECWKGFRKRMKSDLKHNPINPIIMVCLTDMLEYTDLLIGFLCCNSADRELLLAKAQKLGYKEEKNE